MSRRDKGRNKPYNKKAANRGYVTNKNDVIAANIVEECKAEMPPLTSVSNSNGTKLMYVGGCYNDDGKYIKTEVLINNNGCVCKFTIHALYVSLYITVSKITFVDNSNTVFAFRASNTVDGELGTIIVNADSLRDLPRYFFQKSLVLKTIDWFPFPDPNGKKDDYLPGVLDIIENEILLLKASYCANKAGVIYKDEIPKYYVGASTILRLDENKFQEYKITDAAFSDADLHIGKDRPVVLQQKGDLNSTLHLINEISQERVAVQTILSAGLSAIIVGILRLMSFVFCISGKSSSGKSTLLKLAASFFDNPLNQAVNRKFSDTTARLMDAIKKSSGVLITIDDTSADVKKKKNQSTSAENDLKQLTYFASGNVARGTKYSVDESFNTVVMITSETPVMEQFGMYNNGANRRMVELDMSGCTGELTKDAEESMRIVEHTRNNYGQLAVAFVRKIYENGVKWLKERYDTICSSIQSEMPSNGIAQGYGETITPIVLAAEIANSLGCMFDVDEIKNSLIEDFVIKAERHESKLTQQHFEDKCIYEAIVKLAFIHCSEYAVDKQLLYVSTKKIDEVSKIFDCSSRKITSLLKAHGLLQEPESKNGADRHSSYKDANGRYYLVKFDKSFLGIDGGNEMFKNNVIDKESIDAWLSENKNILRSALSPALAAKWDIRVVLEKGKYIDDELIVIFRYKLTNNEYVCPYTQMYGTHNMQRTLNSETGGNMTSEEFDEVQELVKKICDNADLTLETVPSQFEKDFTAQLVQMVCLIGANFYDGAYYEKPDSVWCNSCTFFICGGSYYPNLSIFFSGVPVGDCKQRMFGIDDNVLTVITLSTETAVKNKFIDNLKKFGLLIRLLDRDLYTPAELPGEIPLFLIDADKLEKIIKDYCSETGKDIPESALRFIERRTYKEE